MARYFMFLSVVLLSSVMPHFLIAAEPTAENAAAGACVTCGGCYLFLILGVVGVLLIHILILVWVAKDSKARGMDSPAAWMLVMFFLGLIGLIVYLFARTKGTLEKCRICGNKRLQCSAKCPHCGNP